MTLDQLNGALGILLALGAISYSLVSFLRRGQHMLPTTLLFAVLAALVFGGYFAFRTYQQPEPAQAAENGQHAPQADHEKDSPPGSRPTPSKGLASGRTAFRPPVSGIHPSDTGLGRDDKQGNGRTDKGDRDSKGKPQRFAERFESRIH